MAMHILVTNIFPKEVQITPSTYERCPDNLLKNFLGSIYTSKYLSWSNLSPNLSLLFLHVQVKFQTHILRDDRGHRILCYKKH